MVILIRGRLRPERANPISRITEAIYLSILQFCLHHRWLTIAVNVVFLVVTSARIALGRPVYAAAI
jgi:Cu(I)/Ag(I) efflux system membrane protein CusA/SilA